MTVPAVHRWPTNGHLIADVAKLGYISGRVVDLTYGKGGFWTQFQPEDLTRHDIKLDGVDYTRLRHTYREAPVYDTVVFDPPYKLTGTPDPALTERYGLEAGVSIEDRLLDMMVGVIGGCRLLNQGGHLLVKCQDQVASSKVWWQTTMVPHWAKTMGLTHVDRFDMLGTSRPQPNGRRQVHAHGRPSTLLVFRKEAK